MPVNRNALIRYTTIDKCLRNRYRTWTLEDLIDACSDALYEFEGIAKGVSRRTVQLDIQNMRSEKLGYNAPIIVTDKKYYSYEDPEYSITNLPLSDQDLNKLNDAVEILKQFSGFNHFKEMTGLIQKLDNKIQTEKNKDRTIIHIDKNEHLKGLEHLNGLYQATLQQSVIKIEYQSFKAQRANRLYLSPYLLKEFNNRWFIIGKKSKGDEIITLALDRIHGFELMKNMEFRKDENFNPDKYYNNVIGVTKNVGIMPRRIKLFITIKHAPYVKTKPIHASQQILKENENGMLIQIEVIPNFELERVLLGFGEGLTVLSPPSLQRRLKQTIKQMTENYQNSLNKDIQTDI